MYPLFLCFFSTYSDGTSTKISSRSDAKSNVWWSPSEPENLKGFEIQEGDILIPTSVSRSNVLKNAIKSKKYLWENGLIPYEFDETLTCDEKNLIQDAMKVIESKTCVRFTEKINNENTYIRFQTEKNGCYAPIGRLDGNEGPLPVNLQSPECFKELGIIEHELLHVVGLFHEQSRPDRDEYVNIHWCNITPFREKNFMKAGFNQTTTFDLPYDYESIMHYPKWAFSKNGKPTITAKNNPDMMLGQRKIPTIHDFEKVANMYNCTFRGNKSVTEENSDSNLN